MTHHFDITTPTVTREPGESLPAWEERKRAARHQRNREDAEITRQIRHHAVTLDATLDAILRGQR